MSPERWKKIEEIFLTAIELRAVPERARYLAQACAGDEELRREVERLLAQDEGAETLLKESVFEESGMHAFAALMQDSDPLIGRRLGSYQIISEIGSGGMGAVYLAERADGAFRQNVWPSSWSNAGWIPTLSCAAFGKSGKSSRRSIIRSLRVCSTAAQLPMGCHIL
jgi:hypothetical protein